MRELFNSFVWQRSFVIGAAGTRGYPLELSREIQEFL
jgi:hypothetical protein